jgi:hypothetical protein
MEALKKFIEQFFLDHEEHMPFEDMVYAYIHCMPLVRSEMSMRQHIQTIGDFVRIPDIVVSSSSSKTPPLYAWGVWLPLSISSFIVDIPAGAHIYMFDIWGIPIKSGVGPDTFLVHMPSPLSTTMQYMDMHSFRSETTIARVIVTTENVEDGALISAKYTTPLVNEYTAGLVESDLHRESAVSRYADPIELSGREFFALVNSLVPANPTKDTKIMRGVIYTESATSPVLEQVKSRALFLMKK